MKGSGECKHSRVWKHFKVGRCAWYLPHAHGDIVSQLSGLHQGVSELLRVF